MSAWDCPAPSPSDVQALRTTARRTWRFFEAIVTPADNMLPPDNFQEDPAPVLAHRTSPTNIGLYLLSTASAHDFGWAGLADTVDRLEATLATMARLQRFRGHFYNWYDTADLRPLEPPYVSTVDSGNLAGHLIALANACGGFGGPARAPGTQPWRAGPGRHRRPRSGRGRTLVPGQPRRRRDCGKSAAALTRLLATGLRHPAATSRASTRTRARRRRSARAIANSHAAGAADLAFWAAALHRHRREPPPGPRTATRAARPPWRHGLLAPRLIVIEQAARGMALAMEFGFLRNPERKLLSIGYLADAGALDANCYDLLASEARLACFVAIAKGDIPSREWFRLGRAVTPTAGGAVLVSWSGSMFEYLMPSLVMRAPDGSLLEDTSRLVVRRQAAFGTAQGVPWGVSESAYNVRDVEYTYQYSNFGIPGLGLKRGLDADLVIAPYATALAAMVDPTAAVSNLARLAAARGAGPIWLL